MPERSTPELFAAEAADRRLRAFRATDAFVIEAYRLSTTLDGIQGRELAREVRRILSRCGGSLVAAAAAKPGDENERRCLERACMGLAEGRYVLYLARRLGLLDLRRYRAVVARQDAAQRELDKARSVAADRALTAAGVRASNSSGR